MLQDFSHRVSQNFNEDIEFMELLKLELIFRCYKITNNLNKYQEELRLITYLLQKHSIDNYYIKLQSEYFLSHLAINQKISNFKEFLINYSPNIVQRSINQIKTLHIMVNKNIPFKVLNQLFVIFKGFYYLENDV